FHDPDAHALVAPGVDVAGVLDRHFRVGSVQAADVLVRKSMLRADEDFPQRPFIAHESAPISVDHAAFFARAARFSACASAASRTQAPSSHAFTRVRNRSRLQGPLPLTTL